MSRNFSQSEVRKREHSDSKKHSKEKLSRSPPRGNIKQSTHGGQDSSRASVKDFVSRGSVREHDNWNGPACPKCDQICKDKGGLRNHVLSHYYEVFFEVLPVVAPFTCPECSREGWRDRITLARHYASAHNKLFKMTDVTPEMLNMSNMELKKSGRRQSDGDVANQNNHVKSNKGYSKLEEEEDLEMKESVAALSVKSDSNFVQWQKSFGKHDAQSG